MISFSFALWTVIWINSIVIIFHALVLLRVIPYDVVWAGRLKSVEEMYVFESVSILINCLLIFIVLIKGSLIKSRIPIKIINGLLWIFVVLFALNTLGNLTSETNLETYVATPLTLILSVLCWRIAVEPQLS